MAKPQQQTNSRSNRKSVSELRPATRTPTPTNGSQDDADEDDEVVDEDLVGFLSSPPAIADHVLVIAAGAGGDQIVQDRSATETKKQANAIAAQIWIACERWAQSERRLVRFRASWMRGDKVLATHAWQCGEDSGAPQLDGSVSSFLQQQQLFAQAQHKLHLEGFEMVQESWKSLLTLQNKRIEALEKDNAELRDRLRKLDDVGSELQIEAQRAELEQRGRTADILEKKVLPLAQALVVRQIQGSAAAAAPAAVPANSEQKHSD